MKRYFEVVGRRQTLLLEVSPPANTASAEELSKQLRMPLREICTSAEYRRLTKQFSEEDEKRK